MSDAGKEAEAWHSTQAIIALEAMYGEQRRGLEGDGWRKSMKMHGRFADAIKNLTARAERAEATITAWQFVVDGICAHIEDRMAMGDPANPQTYLNIIKANVGAVEKDSEQFIRSRWHDAKVAQDQLADMATARDAALADVARLRTLLKCAFLEGYSSADLIQDGPTRSLEAWVESDTCAALASTSEPQAAGDAV